MLQIVPMGPKQQKECMSVLTDLNVGDKSVTNKSVTDKSVTDKSVTDEYVIDKTVTDLKFIMSFFCPLHRGIYFHENILLSIMY